VKKVIAASFAVAVTVLSASACSLDATRGAGGSQGPAGSLGSGCQCPSSQNDCDAANGGCQTGLICAKGDVSSTEQICTQGCPCPVNFVCKAVGNLGGRLLCFHE
jgi:hypothetical protein